MAHKLAHNSGDSSSDSDERTGEQPNDSDRKLVLNRRKYVMTGAATMAALVTGTGSVQASASGVDDPDAYWTDFSEAQL